MAIGELLYYATDDLTRFIAARMPQSLHNVVDVDDVLQDTFDAACRDIKQLTLRKESSFQAWLRVVAEHRLQDAARSLSRKKRGGDRRRIETIPHFERDSVFNLLDELAVDDSTPLRRASRQEAVRCMRIALGQLPELQRSVLRLQYVEGKSHQEIAQAIGRTAPAVHGLIKRAKQALRNSLGKASAYLSSR